MGSDKPAERYSRLRPWLRFANLANPAMSGPSGPDPMGLIRRRDFIRKFNAAGLVQTQDFPLSDIKRLLEAGPRRRQRERYSAHQLALVVWSMLRDIASTPEGQGTHFDISAKVALDWGPGRLRAQPTSSVLSSFAQALDGTEPERIRQCPVCQSIFYAVRTTGQGQYNAGSKACPGRCTQTWRQQEWRRHEADRVKRAWVLHRAGKDLTAVARNLGVSIHKARAYLARARKEHNDEPLSTR